MVNRFGEHVVKNTVSGSYDQIFGNPIKIPTKIPSDRKPLMLEPPYLTLQNEYFVPGYAYEMTCLANIKTKHDSMISAHFVPFDRPSWNLCYVIRTWYERSETFFDNELVLLWCVRSSFIPVAEYHLNRSVSHPTFSPTFLLWGILVIKQS